MDLLVTCTCGAQHKVTTAQAGSLVQCHCGRMIAVPSLGELRTLAGHQRYEVSVVDKLRQMELDGRLPEETNCLECGTATDNVLKCSVECERPYAQGDGFWKTFFSMIFAPVWILNHLENQYRSPEVLGKDIVIRAPLRLCPTCAEKIAPRIRQLHHILRRNPLYNQLLANTPKPAPSSQSPNPNLSAPPVSPWFNSLPVDNPFPARILIKSNAPAPIV